MHKKDCCSMKQRKDRNELGLKLNLHNTKHAVCFKKDICAMEGSNKIKFGTSRNKV